MQTNAPGVGGWGGTCTCPDGQVYQVGDNKDTCGSLACIGGEAGTCSPQNKAGANVKVTCVRTGSCCQIHQDEKCESCNEGYQLTDDKLCVIKDVVDVPSPSPIVPAIDKQTTGPTFDSTKNDQIIDPRL